MNWLLHKRISGEKFVTPNEYNVEKRKKIDTERNREKKKKT